jgi:signal transduction histidine kinase
MSHSASPSSIDDTSFTPALGPPPAEQSSLAQAATVVTACNPPPAEEAQPAVTPPVRVLLIEDNCDDALVITHTLSKTNTLFQVCHADCLAQAREQLLNGQFDVILTDLSLPDCDGVESVTAIRQVAPRVPLVVLTGLSSDPVAFEALKLGAQDYLTKKGASSDVMERAIRYAIQRQRNTEMEAILETLRASERLLGRKNKRLARLNRTARRFVDNVSHEFRTPLTVIMEYVSIVRDGLVGELNEEQRRLLDVTVDRTDDLNNMVNDMLDVSRLGAGILGICRSSCRMEEIVDHVRVNLERKAAIKGVTIEIEFAPDLPAVYCDREKIGRVLINLAVNAIKFSGQGSHVRIHVRCDVHTREVVTSIMDAGPGIEPQRLGELFKRFKQLGTESQASTKGFGLGLNIAKELVALNFGQIRVESQVGVGSTFSFTVPIDDPIEVTRRYLSQVKGLTELSLLEVEVETSTLVAVADDVDAFLNRLLRGHDIIFRAAERRWVLLLSASESEVESFLERSRKTLQHTNRNRPYEPLPEVKTNRIGTWKIPRDEILDAVRGALGPPGPVAV